MRKTGKTLFLLLAAAIASSPIAVHAGNGSDAVVGSILGGATGAIIGNSLGGRDGAIVGGAIGAAAGVTIATDDRGGRHDRYDDRYTRVYDTHYRDDDRYYRGTREVIVVESPRHYYRGNEFVYGVPPGRGHHRGWQRHHYDHRGNVIIIKPAPRYEYHSHDRYRDDYRHR